MNSLTTKLWHFAGSLLLTVAILGAAVACTQCAPGDSQQDPKSPVPPEVVKALEGVLRHVEANDPNLPKARAALETVRLWREGKVNDAEGKAAVRELAALLRDVAEDLRERQIPVPPALLAILAFAETL